MRKLLFESLFRRPFTEPAPTPDDAAVAELATAVGHAARRRLGASGARWQRNINEEIRRASMTCPRRA